MQRSNHNVLRRSRLLLGLVIAVAAPATALVLSRPATASFPGQNGRIVFTNSGVDGASDIYTMNADGSDRRDLTMNPAVDRGGKWSPDGKQIVFSSNRTGSFEIYVMNADGSGVRQLTDSSSVNDTPAFTADGRHVVFETNRDGNFEIYRMNADGSAQTDLTNNPADDLLPATSGHGQRIAFTSYRSGLARLYTMDGDGSNQLEVPGGPAEESFANWSPNGNDLVFLGDTGPSATDDDVYTAHMDGSGLVRVTNTPDLFEQTPAWSPDGKRIVYDACTIFVNGTASCQITTANRDGSDVIGLVHAPPTTPLLDTFDSNTVNTDLWRLQNPAIHPGETVAITNQRLEITIGPGPVSPHVNAGLSSACLLHGDYDIQIDFSLLDWPAGNGTFLFLVVNANGNMGLSSGAPNDNYATFFEAPGAAAATTDTSGTLRIVRTGSTVSGYYLHNGSWVLLQSAPASTIDTSWLPLAGSGGGTPSGQLVRIAYDNFRINSGQLICPIQGTAADWGAVLN